MTYRKPNTWTSWVRIWNQREPATALAWVRIGIGLTIAYDLSHMLALDLAHLLFAPANQGGLSNNTFRHRSGAFYETLQSLYQTISDHPQILDVLLFIALITAFTFAIGLFTRTSGVLLLFTHVALGFLFSPGDRGVEMFLRQGILILLCSQSHVTWSFDAWRKTKRFFHPHRHVPAWPRYLLVLQLLWLYFSAGMNKTHSTWWNLSALYYILQNPHFARVEMPWLHHIYPLTQLGTASALTFELGSAAILMLLIYRTIHPRGRFTKIATSIRSAYIIAGIVFHLVLGLTMRLGIFPFGILAFYPAYLTPESLFRCRKIETQAYQRLKNFLCSQ